MGSAIHMQQLPWPGVSAPEAKHGSNFYNQGQIPAQSASYFAQFASLWSVTKPDTKQYVMENAKMDEKQFKEDFGEVPDPMVFNDLENIAGNLETLNVTTAVLDNIFNNVGNDNFWKEVGYFDSQAGLAVLENIDIPQLTQDLKTNYQEETMKLVAPMLKDLEKDGSLDKQQRDELVDMIGALLDTVNPQAKQSLIDGDNEALKQALSYISEELMDDLAEKISSYTLTDGKKQKIKELGGRLLIKVVTPAIAMIAVNTFGRAMTDRQRQDKNAIAKRESEAEREIKCLEQKHQAKNRAERKAAQAKAAQRAKANGKVSNKRRA